jgi:hypothetical protein
MQAPGEVFAKTKKAELLSAGLLCCFFAICLGELKKIKRKHKADVFSEHRLRFAGQISFANTPLLTIHHRTFLWVQIMDAD